MTKHDIIVIGAPAAGRSSAGEKPVSDNLVSAATISSDLPPSRGGK